MKTRSGETIDVYNYTGTLLVVLDSGSQPHAEEAYLTPEEARALAQTLNEYADRIDPPPRWFKDFDGDYWRENKDGTLTVVWSDNKGGYTDSVHYREYGMEFVKEHFGPLKKCEAPCEQ